MLPLPVARLRRRGTNAKSPKDRHDHVWFGFEVSVKLALAAQAPRDVAALARGSLGTWVAALDVSDIRLEDEASIALHALLSEIGAGTATPRRVVGARELLGLLAGYRNHVIGHATVRDAAFYERAARVLADGLESAWNAGLFLPVGARLAYVDTIELGSGGDRRARVLDLSRENAHADTNVPVPADLEPRRVVLRVAEEWRVLHPWVLYREEPEGCFVFNQLARNAEFLDYATSAFLRGSAAEELSPGITSALKARFSVGGARVESEPRTASDVREIGGFELLGELGRGGMGLVHLARQPLLGRHVALKTLPAVHAENAVARARFEREVRALARSDHENVVKVLCSGSERGGAWFAMECVLGADLRAVLAEREREPDFGRACDAALAAAVERLAKAHPSLGLHSGHSSAPRDEGWRRFARFFAGAARGVAHLHAKGILHRDLSPANVMVNAADGRAVVMDLGLAAVEDASVTLTRDKDQILGTLRYLAPDQFTRKVVELDGRADVYSLGAVMHELATGAALFDGETEAHLMRQILTEEPRPMRALRRDAPRELEAVVLQALEKRREARQASMAVLAEQLEAIAEGRMPDAPGLKAGYRARKALARNAKWFVAAGLVGAGFIGSRWAMTGSNAASTPTVSTEGGLSRQQVDELKRVASPEIRAKIEELLALERELEVSPTRMARAGGPRPDFGGTRSAIRVPIETEAVVSARSAARAALAPPNASIDGAVDGRVGVVAALEAMLTLPLEESTLVVEELYDLSTRALELDEFDVARRGWERVEALRSKAARDDNLRLQAIENHGWCLHLSGQHEAAKVKLEEVLVELQGNWPDAPRTQRARLKFALVAEARNEGFTARTVARLALSALESAPPSALPDLVVAERILARADLAGGRAQEAHDRLARLDSRLQGVEDFPERYLCDFLFDFAQTKLQTGQPAAARDLLLRVVENRRRSSPASSEGRVRAELDLARAHMDLGERSAARPLLEGAVTELHASRGDEHPLTWLARFELARLLAEDGEEARASEQLGIVLQARSRRLPSQHPDLLTTKVRHAELLSALGDELHAGTLHREVVEAMAQTLPDAHSDLLAARQRLAASLAAAGDFAGAREELEHVLEVLARTLPSDHEDVATARTRLANTLRRMGASERALEVESGRWP